jgi:hypothetical protein
VVANETLLKTFDITTMSKEDAAFTVPWLLRVTKNDYVHALVSLQPMRAGWRLAEGLRLRFAANRVAMLLPDALWGCAGDATGMKSIAAPARAPLRSPNPLHSCFRLSTALPPYRRPPDTGPTPRWHTLMWSLRPATSRCASAPRHLRA